MGPTGWRRTGGVRSGVSGGRRDRGVDRGPPVPPAKLLAASNPAGSGKGTAPGACACACARADAPDWTCACAVKAGERDPAPTGVGVLEGAADKGRPPRPPRPEDAPGNVGGGNGGSEALGASESRWRWAAVSRAAANEEAMEACWAEPRGLGATKPDGAPPAGVAGGAAEAPWGGGGHLPRDWRRRWRRGPVGGRGRRWHDKGCGHGHGHGRARRRGRVGGVRHAAASHRARGRPGSGAVLHGVCLVLVAGLGHAGIAAQQQRVTSWLGHAQQRGRLVHGGE